MTYSLDFVKADGFFVDNAACSVVMYAGCCLPFPVNQHLVVWTDLVLLCTDADRSLLYLVGTVDPLVFVRPSRSRTVGPSTRQRGSGFLFPIAHITVLRVVELLQNTVMPSLLGEGLFFLTMFWLESPHNISIIGMGLFNVPFLATLFCLHTVGD